MQSSEVLEQIDKLGELPILPQTLLQIQKVATDDRSSADDLAEVILKDQALTARVLRIVNSAFYTRRRQQDVRTVSKAVIVMGFETVRKVALGLSVFDMMSKLARSPHMMLVAEHSTIVAAFAQRLAELARTVPPEEAFVAALLHDIGKLVLMECSADQYDRVLADVAMGMPSIEAERKHFGMSHDRAGRKLAARWDLPIDIQNLIGDHHDIDPTDPPKKADPLLAIIAFSDAMSRFLCVPETTEREFAILRGAGRCLGIPQSRLEELYVEIGELIRALATDLDVRIGNLQDYAALINVEGGRDRAPKLTQEELAKRTADLLALYREIGSGLAHGSDPEKLLKHLLDGILQVLGFERVVLLRVDRTTRRFAPWMAVGEESDVIARCMDLPIEHDSGALALTVLQRRPFHVPMAASEVYGGLAGRDLLLVTDTTGYATAPVVGPDGVEGVIWADLGASGPDVPAELASELAGLAAQAGLVVGAMARIQ